MANCPKCGEPLLENARYCTSCGYETLRPKEIFEIPVYREWESYKTDDLWDRPYLEMDFSFASTTIWSKAQFIILTLIYATPLVLMIPVLIVSGYWPVAIVPCLLLVGLWFIFQRLKRIGDRNLAWAKVLDEMIGHTPSDAGTIEEENPRYGRRI